MVAGENAEAPRVERQRTVDAVLGAEVPNRARHLCLLSIEPRLPGLEVGVELANSGRVAVVHGLDLLDLAPPGAVDARQELDGIVILLPTHRVERAPQLAAFGVPRPPHVVCEVDQPFEAGRDRELGIRQGRDRDHGCTLSESLRKGRADTLVAHSSARCVVVCAPADRPPGVSSSA